LLPNICLAPRIRLSLHECGWLENQDECELDGIQDDDPEGIQEWELELEGIHDELELIDGNQELDDEPGYQEEPLENQSDDEREDISDEPITTPTPKPIPNTVNTVESG
jgi:hypothetical protein